jgi:hypothetical protein
MDFPQIAHISEGRTVMIPPLIPVIKSAEQWFLPEPEPDDEEIITPKL